MRVRAVVVALALGGSAAARAQGGFLLQGTLDAEAWSTDTSSTLLQRNGGDPAALYRLRLWSAIEPRRALFLFANGVAEGGNARQFDGAGTSVTLEQGGLRLARHRALVINVGRMIHPLGAFGGRVLSTRNPLIGVPDGYTPVYPDGAMINGEKGKVDYRAAAVSRPLTHRDYVPSASPYLRPVIGFGVTPVVGFRIGASASDGSYLNKELSDQQLDGRSWQSYRQRVIAGELHYGFGHYDFRAEYAAAKFEVPRNGWIDGQAAYAEARATLTPRIFVASRVEMNRYPFIRPVSPTLWVSRRTEFKGLEVGGGFRFSASTLIKASYRADDWVVTPQNSGFIKPGGRAVAVQLSQSFDVMDWR